jgi:hypothetical protein
MAVCSFMGFHHGCGDRTVSWGRLIVARAGIADKVGVPQVTFLSAQ